MLNKTSLSILLTALLMASTGAKGIGLKVFPRQWTDVKRQCCCPDLAVPCKHLAAVIYQLSAEIDNNPFLDIIFIMRK